MSWLTVLALTACVALGGCGKEAEAPIPNPRPTPEASLTPTEAAIAMATVTPTPTATPTPTPNPTVHHYGYNDITICAAFHSWNPNTTTITTPCNGAGDCLLVFSWQGVFIANPDGSNPIHWGYGGNTVSFIREDIHGVICTVTVHDGVYQGVSP